MNLDKSQRKLLLTCILLGGISNLLFGVNKQNNAFLPSYVELSTKSAINENLSANAAVYDLSSNWTIEPYHGNISNPPYSHMSVRSYTNNLSYGYSWESKLGEMARVMHPRYALTGYYANSSPDHRAHGVTLLVNGKIYSKKLLLNN